MKLKCHRYDATGGDVFNVFYNSKNMYETETDFPHVVVVAILNFLSTKYTHIWNNNIQYFGNNNLFLGICHHLHI
jgi:hypothetical protein